jgi:hypothetical protein
MSLDMDESVIEVTPPHSGVQVPPPLVMKARLKYLVPSVAAPEVRLYSGYSEVSAYGENLP